MGSLFNHGRLAGSAVVLNPYATPFMYTPTFYCLTAPLPFQPCCQPSYYFQEPPPQLPPLAMLNPYATPYSYPSTHVRDSAKAYIPIVAYSLAGEGGASAQETYAVHNAVTTLNQMKSPNVGRHQFTGKMIRRVRFTGSGASNKVMARIIQFNKWSAAEEKRTTVMIRNIPNKISREVLMRMLDGHCAAQNETVEGSALVSAYDFLYLPIDFKHRCNKGYAFVNFTTPEACRRLYQSLNGYKWELFGSSKITRICYARIQGKEALMRHFRNSMFECNTDEFLPVALSPPRDGSNSLPSPSVLGRRVGFHG